MDHQFTNLTYARSRTAAARERLGEAGIEVVLVDGYAVPRRARNRCLVPEFVDWIDEGMALLSEVRRLGDGARVDGIDVGDAVVAHEEVEVLPDHLYGAY